MYALLDNIVWNTLTGPHARYASGTARVRRYSPGFSPLIGFADAQRPHFEGFGLYCEHGEHFYTDGWASAPPPGWQVETESTMFKMVWEGAPPATDDAPDAVKLGSEHAAQALELALLTRPGPFGLRTIELGEYFGYFEGERLIAMAGERMCAGRLREISGVCTHPDFQGRGLARRLTAKLVRLEMLRNETPFLHVMRDNESAHRLYGCMGFRDYRESVVRIVSPC